MAYVSKNCGETYQFKTRTSTAVTGLPNGGDKGKIELFLPGYVHALKSILEK